MKPGFVGGEASATCFGAGPRIVFVVTVALLASAAASQLAIAQQPLPKSGPCPTGYYSSGAYCVPASPGARAALPKTGPCPAGYHTSGAYCLASSDRSKAAVAKHGPCPSGYHTSGAYCLRN